MENTLDLRDQIRRISIETKFSPVLLEKDYHLTRILHKIAGKNMPNLVFKGGTCLNKCYLGFYRLSEDLDFVYNIDLSSYSKQQVRKILDTIRREWIAILDELGFDTSKELGKGWKMLISKETKKIIGLEISTSYSSLADGSLQKIKLEVSFRKVLINPTTIKSIHHEFVDDLGNPMLPKDVKIEVIDLSENFAEKIRALLTRRDIAARDIYDINFILKNNILKINHDIIALVLAKINESKKNMFSEEDLMQFFKNLEERVSGLSGEEINSVLKSGEKVDMKSMAHAIAKAFADYEQNKE
jgi:predicted nucleotidyltransferase component of viral defense system